MLFECVGEEEQAIPKADRLGVGDALDDEIARVLERGELRRIGAGRGLECDGGLPRGRRSVANHPHPLVFHAASTGWATAMTCKALPNQPMKLTAAFGARSLSATR
jgi:hypothetical protein